MDESTETPTLGIGIKGVIAIALVIAIIGLIAAMAIPEFINQEESTTTDDQTETQETAEGTESTDTATPYSRDATIVRFGSHFNFEQVDSVEGYENYLGMQIDPPGANFIQLIGTEDKLIQGTLSLSVDVTDPGDAEQEQLVIDFARGIYAPSQQWVVQDYYNVVEEPLSGYTAEQLYGEFITQTSYQQMDTYNIYSVTYSDLDTYNAKQ